MLEHESRLLLWIEIPRSIVVSQLEIIGIVLICEMRSFHRVLFRLTEEIVQNTVIVPTLVIVIHRCHVIEEESAPSIDHLI